MIALLLLALCGAPKSPSVEALASYERQVSSLPCGIDEELYVPDEGELAALRSEATATLGRAPTFRRLRVTLTARGIIRKQIGKRRNLSCEDIIGIHDAALERAEELIPETKPTRQSRSRPSFTEQALRGGFTVEEPKEQR